MGCTAYAVTSVSSDDSTSHLLSLCQDEKYKWQSSSVVLGRQTKTTTGSHAFLVKSPQKSSRSAAPSSLIIYCECQWTIESWFRQDLTVAAIESKKICSTSRDQLRRLPPGAPLDLGEAHSLLSTYGNSMEIAGNAQKCHYNYQNKKTSMIDGCVYPQQKRTPSQILTHQSIQRFLQIQLIQYSVSGWSASRNDFSIASKRPTANKWLLK